MRLVFARNDLNIELKENQINIITVENPRVLREIIYDLTDQINGLSGDIILSEADKMLNLSKVTEIINVFSIDINERKILTKLYSEITINTRENLAEEAASINSLIVSFMDKLIDTVPYGLSMSLNMDMAGLLKLYDVKFDDQDLSFIERLINYIKLEHQLLKKEIFVFVNLKMYLNKDEILGLYEFAFYEHIYIIIVEGAETEALSGELHQVLDNDLCWICY